MKRTWLAAMLVMGGSSLGCKPRFDTRYIDTIIGTDDTVHPLDPHEAYVAYLGSRGVACGSVSALNQARILATFDTCRDDDPENDKPVCRFDCELVLGVDTHLDRTLVLDSLKVIRDWPCDEVNGLFGDGGPLPPNQYHQQTRALCYRQLGRPPELPPSRR